MSATRTAGSPSRASSASAVIGPAGGEKLAGLAAHAPLRAALRAALGRGSGAEADAQLSEAA